MREGGPDLGPIELHVTPDVVQAYAEVAVDFNPIHFQPDAAHSVGLPAPSAHGMISGALLSRLLTRAFGERWLRSGELSIKFVRPVLVGDTVVARATGRPESPFVLDLIVENGAGIPVIVGTASHQNISGAHESDSTSTSTSGTVESETRQKGVR